MKEIMEPEVNKEHPRRMSNAGWWFRIIGGAIVVVLSIVLSIVFIVTSLGMWYYRAWGAPAEIGAIALVVVFMVAVAWCYVSGLLELIRGRRDGTLVLEGDTDAYGVDHDEDGHADDVVAPVTGTDGEDM